MILIILSNLFLFSFASCLNLNQSFSQSWLYPPRTPYPYKQNQSDLIRVVQYDLTLVASDSLNESVTQVVILIKDSNDLPPVFNQTMYIAHALEEMADPLPFKLLQVVFTPCPSSLIPINQSSSNS